MNQIALPRFPGCFVCGPDNHSGLNLPFYGTEEGVEASWTPQQHHIGYAQTIHGGLLSSALEEAVIWAVFHATGRVGVTAEVNVRFKRPVIVGDALTVKAQLIDHDKRLWLVEGEIVNQEGRALVTASARIHPLSPEKTSEMLKSLDEGSSSTPL
jgi:uncharacterized protein (TIGR00369 family)